jgi:hypothetical protein
MSKPSAKRRLDFDESSAASSNKKIPKVVEEEDGQVMEVVPVSAVYESQDIVTGTPQKRKTALDSYFSPVASSRRKKSAVVTPEKVESTKKAKHQGKKEDGKAYVPVYIHKNLGYQRYGQASITDELKKTFALVEEHYEIPSDFETNKKYGPLSGTCFEERAVAAYNHGLLKSSSRTGVEICSHCATAGHKRDDCPALI